MVDDTTETPSPPLVVTIFESYGAGADRIGPRVADALGLPSHAQAFSSEELEEAEAGRDTSGTLSRVMSVLGSSTAHALGATGQEIPAIQRDMYELALENTRIVQEQARQGGVIVGRNGAFVLADRPAAFHVRLDAPVQVRVSRAEEAAGIDAERAAKRRKREDELRAEMSLTFYGWDPRELDYYDVVVNTAGMDDETCASVIVAAARAKAGLQA